MPKSLADKHQLLQAYQSSGSMFNPNSIITNSQKYYPELYNSKIKDALQKFDLSDHNVVVTDKVIVHGTLYTTDLLVILTYDIGLLKLGQISLIVIKNKKTVLLVLREKTANHVTELGVFEIVSSAYSSIVCKSLDDIDNYAPLKIYHRGGRLLIPLKHQPLWRPS